MFLKLEDICMRKHVANLRVYTIENVIKSNPTMSKQG
jgi:hypothetical protein